MKFPFFLLLSLIFVSGSRAAAGPVEELCSQFASGAEVRVYRGFPQPAFARDLLERAKQAGCISILGEVFYPDTKTLGGKDAADWLALAANSDSYYPSKQGPAAVEESFHADIAFWCVTPDHKYQAYCLVSFATSQVQVATTDKGVTVAMTFELEKLSRTILQHYFEQELKEEQNTKPRKATS